MKSNVLQGVKGPQGATGPAGLVGLPGSKGEKVRVGISLNYRPCWFSYEPINQFYS